MVARECPSETLTVASLSFVANHIFKLVRHERFSPWEALAFCVEQDQLECYYRLEMLFAISTSKFSLR